jgi:hypothetical protein
MSDVLPARSPARCCSTALFRNSAASVNSLMTLCCSKFLPGVLEAARFEILDRRFECRHSLPLRLE